MSEDDDLAHRLAPGQAVKAFVDLLEPHPVGEELLDGELAEHLEQLAVFPSADELLRHARASTVAPVEPRVVREGETARIVLPGEPGYEAPPAG